MNFFFGIEDNEINCEIQIPLFRNKFPKSESYDLYSDFPKNDVWQINKFEKEKNLDFYLVKKKDISNKKFFFFSKR